MDLNNLINKIGVKQKEENKALEYSRPPFILEGRSKFNITERSKQ